MIKDIKSVPFYDIDITGGFWKQKQELVKDKTVKAVYERFLETGRFDAFKCEWMIGNPLQPHHFWESDIAKWIEGVSYILEKEKNEDLVKIVDEVVDNIEKNQDATGYYGSFFTVVKPKGERFSDRTMHELYTAGHLVEAAVAYYHATGKKKFLQCMCKYIDYIEKAFKIEKFAKFITPGHEEIELALVKLYKVTGEKRYLDLSEYFVLERGKAENEPKSTPAQDQSPAKDMISPEGHAVRAMYFYSGMADIAKLKNDEDLYNACKKIFESTYKRRMYITGGVGSTYINEAFTGDYDLPNDTAYAETCAAIGLSFFCKRMQECDIDSRYADTIEKVIYNGFLSGLSLSGEEFFYENPLEMKPYKKAEAVYRQKQPLNKRVKVFNCSCCPPNIIRYIPSIADFLYTTKDKTLFVHQFMQSEGNINSTKVIQNTNYPQNGKITLEICGNNFENIAIRIPSWCDKYSFSKVPNKIENGYAYMEKEEKIEITFEMQPEIYSANPNVYEDSGKYAMMYGPIVYCLESAYNEQNIFSMKIIPETQKLIETQNEFLMPTIVAKSLYKTEKGFENSLYIKAKKQEFKETTAKFIPYYAFANKEEVGMRVYFEI